MTVCRTLRNMSECILNNFNFKPWLRYSGHLTTRRTPQFKSSYQKRTKSVGISNGRQNVYAFVAGRPVKKPLTLFCIRNEALSLFVTDL